MISSKTCDAFLALVRLGIGHESYALPKEIDWTAIKALADVHGLSAVVLDGLNRLPLSILNSYGLSQLMRLEWIGEILQNYEARYKAYGQAIGSLAGFYNQHGFRMMVLKGYACSLDWPNPEHRSCGDIDIWQFGEQQNADVCLMNEKGINVDMAQHHHTVFYWNGFMVENHFDFLNVHHHKSNMALETILKDLGSDSRYSTQINSEKIYLPSPNLHALFLLRHTMGHFAAEHVQLRQILDWAFLVKCHSKEIDWVWLEGILDKYGMMPMYQIMNAICVEDLGFDVVTFQSYKVDNQQKMRVLKEILEPEFGFGLPSGLRERTIFKIRRWYGSTWKHKLCYKESTWSAFWSGVKSHLLKPSSI